MNRLLMKLIHICCEVVLDVVVPAAFAAALLLLPLGVTGVLVVVDRS